MPITTFCRPGTSTDRPGFAPLLVLSLAVLVSLGGFLTGQPGDSGLESITAADLRVRVEYLASDQFRGRGNGTPELERAAAYIAEVFEANGLEPVGDDGYFQEFAVDRLSLGSDNVLEIPGRAPALGVGRDFVPITSSADGVVEAPLVFAGYGIRAPELGYDDLAGVDLEGRVALVLDRYPRAGDPDSPFATLRPDYGSVEAKVANLAEAGAVGALIVHGPIDGDPVSIGYLADGLRDGLSPRRSTMDLAPGAGDPAIPAVRVSRAGGERLVPSLGTLQESINRDLTPRTERLADRVILHVDLERDTYTARNVVGRIRGSGGALREEVIVVGAHYDHDGAEGTRIWNGADDNASGTSALLELAEAFSSGPRPDRSVILAAWAAEEKGMLGSRHYVRASDLDRTVGMFQLDMIGRNEEHGANRSEGVPAERADENDNAINVLGSIFSPDLRSALERANSEVGLDLRFRYDYGADDLLRRSDHWSFIERDIPALFLFGGLHPDYHTPNDTADKINYPKLERVVRLVYRALIEVGGAGERPAFTNPSNQ